MDCVKPNSLIREKDFLSKKKKKAIKSFLIFIVVWCLSPFKKVLMTLETVLKSQSIHINLIETKIYNSWI